jgi:hypothetical protein
MGVDLGHQWVKKDATSGDLSGMEEINIPFMLGSLCLLSTSLLMNFLCLVTERFNRR